MPVNDSKVRALIDGAMRNGGTKDACCGRADVAFRSLQKERQVAGASLNMDLAAAEHFLFARIMVCTGFVSPTQMRALVVGYDAKKWIDRLRGTPNATAVTANPVSPPDKDVVRWGLAGVAEGSADHDRCNPTIKPPAWQSLERIFGPGHGIGPY